MSGVVCLTPTTPRQRQQPQQILGRQGDAAHRRDVVDNHRRAAAGVDDRPIVVEDRCQRLAIVDRRNGRDGVIAGSRQQRARRSASRVPSDPTWPIAWPCRRRPAATPANALALLRCLQQRLPGRAADIEAVEALRQHGAGQPAERARAARRRRWRWRHQRGVQPRQAGGDERRRQCRIEALKHAAPAASRRASRMKSMLSSRPRPGRIGNCHEAVDGNWGVLEHKPGDLLEREAAPGRCRSGRCDERQVHVLHAVRREADVQACVSAAIFSISV